MDFLERNRKTFEEINKAHVETDKVIEDAVAKLTAAISKKKPSVSTYVKLLLRIEAKLRNLLFVLENSQTRQQTVEWYKAKVQEILKEME